MNRDRVTVDGVEGARPQRDAVTGTAGRSGSPSGRRGGRREQRMVPDAEPTSYYGLPVLNRPVWEARDIAGYFYLGGLAGGSSIVAALGSLTGCSRLARRAKVAAVGAVSLSAAALVHDLGRPDRFYNMLRVLKPTSPMSVGSWLLAVYAPAASVAAATDVSGRLRHVGGLATASAAVLGSTVSTYTAVLISDTAVPAWHDGRSQMPIVFAASSASAAAGFGLIACPAPDNAPMRRLAVGASLLEEVALEQMTRSMGDIGDVYHHGKAGRLLRAARGCTIPGVVLAARAARNRVGAAAAGCCLMAGSALTRFGIFHAGVASAEDPAATVGPQRRRLDREAAAGVPSVA